MTEGISRRKLFGAAAAGVAVGAGAGVGGAALAGGSGGSASAARVIPFDGPHQGAVLAPNAAFCTFTAYDVEPAATAARVAGLLRGWTAAGRSLSRGDAAYRPASLAFAIGFGPSLLRRFRVPVPVAPIPAFPRDELDPARSGGDLGVLVTGDDAVGVARAVRALGGPASGVARVRWQMNGFSQSGPDTPRNLMGQLDGTGNPRPADPGFASHIFASSPGWMRGGSYLVFRRIRMLLGEWETLPAARREQIVGRRLDTGAPLSGGTEFTPFDLSAQRPDGSLAIPASAHVRQAAAQSNEGATILRKGFSYSGGYRADGTPDAGLLFMAFQADPANGFTRIQQRLALADDLSRFLRHSSSALFAVPGGARPASSASYGGYIGQELMESL